MKWKDLYVNKMLLLRKEKVWCEVANNAKDVFCGSKKANKRCYDSNYTKIGVDNGVAVFCMVGNHYAECSCRLNERPITCTDEKAKECINKILSLLNDKDRSEIGNVVLYERK